MSALEGMQNAVRIEGGREEASAAITGGILGEALKSGYAVDERTIEAAAAAQQQSQEEEEAPGPPPDPVDEIVESLQTQQADKIEDVSEAVAEPEEDDDFHVPDFESEVDKELLDEEISASSDDSFEDEAWENEPQDREALKRARVAERKAAYYENLTAQREKKKWEAEADKHYPYWRARGDITATSKRGFLRAAKESSDAVKPFIAQGIKTRVEQLEQERTQVRSEEKEKAKEAWGKPTVSHQVPANTGIDFEAEIRKARGNQDLAKVLSLKRLQAEMTGGEQE